METRRARFGANPFHRSAAAALLSALLGSCATTQDVTRDLPELPADLAKDLAPARTVPVLMTRPLTLVRPLPAAALPLVPPRACTTVYEGYVTYPITVCHPPVILEQAAAASFTRLDPSLGKTASFEAKHFKLSAHPAIRVAFPPWFCTVRGGPWYGYIEGRQICNVDPNVRVFTAQILGAPEPVVVTWTGAIENVPPPLNLVSVTATGEFCTCCSGVMCPDGSCKPKFENCQVMPPAIK
jgi:hypothetical protein